MRMSPSWRQIDRQNHKGCEQRQTDTDKEKKRKKREKKSKRAIKKQRTPCFRNNDFPADRKRCLSCCNIHVSDRTQGVSGLLHYLKKRERVEIIKNASEIMHFSDSIHHCFGTLDPLREVSEQREGGEALAPAPTAKEEDG